MGLIANKDCTISIAPFTAVKMTIESPATKDSINNKDILLDGTKVILGTIADEAGSICTAMIITLSASSKKVTSNDTAVLLVGDKGSATGTFVNSSGSPEEETVTATITNAGQTVTSGN